MRISAVLVSPQGLHEVYCTSASNQGCLKHLRVLQRTAVCWSARCFRLALLYAFVKGL